MYSNVTKNTYPGFFYPMGTQLFCFLNLQLMKHFLQMIIRTKIVLRKLNEYLALKVDLVLQDFKNYHLNLKLSITIQIQWLWSSNYLKICFEDFGLHVIWRFILKIRGMHSRGQKNRKHLHFMTWSKLRPRPWTDMDQIF